AEVNASAVRAVLEGQTGAVRDAVLVNAAAALAAHAGVNGALVESLAAGMRRAAEAVDSGAAAALLGHWAALSTELAG
ncbi:MAG: anthranilate phosphoribosyltransferase, partial [Mycobacteriaceae bacterium]